MHGAEPKLEVVFNDDVKLSYRRCPRGFGIEIGMHNIGRRLGYSEENKTLISPTRKSLLPGMVVEWLCGAQSLVQLVRARNENAGARTTTASDVDASAKGMCKWPKKDPQFLCKVDLQSGRYMFLGCQEKKRLESSAGEESEWEELWYCKDKGNWLLQVAGEKEVCIPQEVAAKIFESVDDNVLVDDLRKDLARCPWMKCPPLAQDKFISCLPGEGLSEVEKQLRHEFCNPALVVEALTHCSAPPDVTPSCERLSMVGEETVTAYVSLHCIDRGSLPIAASARAVGLLTEECLECSSLAAPKSLLWWRQAVEHSPASRPTHMRPSLEESRRRILACCNHASYALSAVQLKLHSLLRYESQQLEVSISQYVRAVRKSQRVSCEDDQAVSSPPAGAPRALGDAFLACIGALVLDGHRAKAEVLIEEHRQRCHGFEKDLESIIFKQRNLSEAQPWDVTASISIVVRHVGSAINSYVVAPPPPPPFTSTADLEKEKATATSSGSLSRLQECVPGFRDVCIVDADLGSQGMRAYGGVSPRAAMLHRGRPPADTKELDPAVDVTQTDVCAVADAATDLYCEVCQIIVNGPEQMEEHKIGKKHRNNHARAARQQASPCGVLRDF